MIRNTDLGPPTPSPPVHTFSSCFDSNVTKSSENFKVVLVKIHLILSVKYPV